MAITVVPTAYGRAASRCLRDAVAHAKRDDPLAPVTVIVPTNSVGVAARRLLASGELGPLAPRGRGVVGVTFLTIYRLAEMVAAPACAAAGRRPVSTPVVAAAVRSVLAERPGMFRPVAEHPATEEALVRAHRELADLDEEHLDVLGAQHARAHEVVRVHRATRDALASDWYDERDLMGIAVEIVTAGTPLVRDFGAIVCYLPQRWSGPEARLLSALAACVPTTIVAGLTGAANADAAIFASVAHVHATLDASAAGAITSECGTHVLSASDADDEVRAIVRGVVNAMREGVPLERMAVLFGAKEPYARLLHEQLSAARIAHNGVAVRSLADSVLARTLLALFALRDGGFRREDVTALFAAAPVLDAHGRRVPGTEWERVSRKAGVVAGVDEWRARLIEYARTLGTDDWAERERARVEALRDFVDELARALEPGADGRSWAGCARWAHRLVRRFLGADARRSAWPAIEQEAARRVEAALDRLGGLDAVDDAPTVEVFRRTLELELNAAHDRVGRLGEGLLAGPVGLALGVELDRVWICGLAEGVFPSVPRDDPLLADGDRAVLAGAMPLKAERVDDDQRAVLAALASTTGTRTCTWPRGDLRRSTERVPSRYLHATLAALAPSDTETIASYAYGIATSPFPSSEHELGVRAALSRERWACDLAEVAYATDLLRARASGAFTRFDGNLDRVRAQLVVVSPLDSDKPISPTRLELWAGCPHAYFMQAILHVEAVDRPEEIMQLSPLDRGSIVHDVLEHFVGDGTQPRERARLRTLAEEACAAAEARGITGRRLLWERDRRVILADLDAFALADEKFRAEMGTETLASELAFGTTAAEHEPVDLEWDDGRRVRLRGKADRIDRTADGGLIVIDYKTGSDSPYNGLTADDPVHGGTRLQLPVYAHAARRAFAGNGAPVEAYYWFVGRGNNKRVGYPVDDDIDNVFHDTLRAIGEGIEGGVFVSNPPPPGPRPFVLCAYCDPDGLGTADRWREWERKYAAPELAGYRALLGDEVPDS